MRALINIGVEINLISLDLVRALRLLVMVMNDFKW